MKRGCALTENGRAHGTLSEARPPLFHGNCQSAFDEIDTNQDGLIDWAQFLTWWNERVWTPDEPS
ncbi:MAG TPA: EF-hand domain-containing protein [Verrucomicrobiae bacterium]|nr:EF-hand domain-containing protein [Verrucomicrobiae bacterium]